MKRNRIMRLCALLTALVMLCAVVPAQAATKSCTLCGGSGRFPCNSCSGGRMRCAICGGTGQRMSQEMVPTTTYSFNPVTGMMTPTTTYTYRTTYLPCSSCSGGYTICFNCHGTGFRSCSLCGGTGRVFTSDPGGSSEGSDSEGSGSEGSDSGNTPEPAVTPEPTEGNPGYYIIPEKTEYTINLSGESTVRVNVTLSCFEDASVEFDVCYTKGADDYVEIGAMDKNPRKLTEKNGSYVYDSWCEIKGLRVGTAKLVTMIFVDGQNYGDTYITFNVIDDPDHVEEPSDDPGEEPSDEPGEEPSDEPGEEPASDPEPERKSIAEARITVKDRTYTGKALKPAVKVKLDGVTLKKGTDYTVSYKNNKKVGKATVTVKGKGQYTGSAKATFRISPKAASGLKLTAGAKRLTVAWKQAAGAGGYEIQYATKKDFSDAVTKTVKKAKTVKATLKKLKAGKKYYVRIRAYKKVKGVKYTSAWSKAKAKKTK